MYCEETIIDGIYHYKTHPDNEWKPYTLKEMGHKYQYLHNKYRALYATERARDGEIT